MYPAYTNLLEDSAVAWTVYGCAAFVLVVAVTLAIRERRERRRLERALATTRQLRRFSTDPLRPAPSQSYFRIWIFPVLAILLGIAVSAWSLWNVLAR